MYIAYKLTDSAQRPLSMRGPQSTSKAEEDDEDVVVSDIYDLR